MTAAFGQLGKDALVKDAREAATGQRGVGTFTERLVQALQAHGGRAELTEFIASLSDPANRSLFERGYEDGRREGARKALEEHIDRLKTTGTMVISFYRSVFDPMLFVWGLEVWFSRRGSEREREAMAAVKARLETYAYYQKIQEVLPGLPDAMKAIVAALKQPGDVIAEVIVQAAAQLSRDFFTAPDPYAKGRVLGQLVGRGLVEALLFVAELLPLPQAAGAAVLAVPRLAGRITAAARDLPRLSRPARLAEVLEEVQEGVALQAARRMDAATPRPFRTPPPGLPPVPDKVDEVVAGLAKLGLPEEVKRFGRGQWEELIDYARLHKRAPSSVKGMLAEQLIESNPRFVSLMSEWRLKLQGDARWDIDTLQYVRRVRGKAPTRISGGSFRDLADGMIVVRARDRQAQPQLRVLAVFEAKSRSNKGELVSRGNEELGQVGWDFERIAENPIEVELRVAPDRSERFVFQPDEVEVSRREARTSWVVILPKGESLTIDQVNKLKRSVPGLQQWNHEVMDVRLQRIAEEVVKLLE